MSGYISIRFTKNITRKRWNDFCKKYALTKSSRAPIKKVNVYHYLNQRCISVRIKFGEQDRSNHIHINVPSYIYTIRAAWLAGAVIKRWDGVADKVSKGFQHVWKWFDFSNRPIPVPRCADCNKFAAWKDLVERIASRGGFRHKDGTGCRA